ncbi:ArsR/SmtB family transcription factor [Pseudomonas sp. 5P_5.1_Bac1]|uniref:ArsR/SmtB family transcription factor n=1 Tax=Pseudomonas sp. 5P_5.1_Bac1 TaxID=2971616 RepID=UPI0021C74693|nr:helix-turn-helix transcriptional regulator [Pseudomonas sp. 5P_5.1_Bac1]MCU1724008.1 ArsR family transcriptional regulator [Pseudomonas sp. 5P_5.1_Bac1]
MQPIASISQIASLMADPKRSAMLWALIDGMARPLEELATLAGLTPSSACAHLARLSAGGLLKREARGRKRYFRLAAPEIGTAVEALASVTIRDFERPATSREQAPVTVPLAMRRARVCWDHLGGEVAADLLQRLLDAQWVQQAEQQLEITLHGRVHFARQGIFIDALAPRDGRLCSLCNCCSEVHDRRSHLGGALGSSLMKLFVQSGWVRISDESRVAQLTPGGLRGIQQIARMPAPLSMG